MPPRRGTPWASHSSLLSDRIRPRSGSPQPTKSEKGKGKGKSKATTPEPPPRSAAVRRLDELLGGLHSLSNSNQPSKTETKKATTAPGAASADREGCFCQAQVHELSEYTPICSSCGLVLCALHPPHRPCPHCTMPLLAAPARAALIAQLEELRVDTLKEEAVAREREAEEMRLAEGAFPVLSGGGSGNAGAAAAAAVRGGGGGHRVISVDSRTNSVRIKTYSGVSRPGLESEEEEEAEAGIEQRVPPPPVEVEYVRVRRGPATRWVDLKGGGGTVKYVTLQGAA